MVQGVGFRYFAYYSARICTLTGWVRNCYDGSVEIEAQGTRDNIEFFIEKLKAGNGFAEVESVSVKDIDVKTGERSFNIEM
jgi:Acylphosphatases